MRSFINTELYTYTCTVRLSHSSRKRVATRSDGHRQGYMQLHRETLVVGESYSSYSCERAYTLVTQSAREVCVCVCVCVCIGLVRIEGERELVICGES